MLEVPGLSLAVHDLGAFDVTDGAEEPAVVASAVEFVLEGLHLAPAHQQGSDPGRDALLALTAMTATPPTRAHLGSSGRRQSATADGTLARQARYSRWDGTQSIVDLEADEILDALAEDVMAEGDLGEALRRLIERGWRGSDPTRQDLAGLQRPARAAAAPARRAARALPAGRRARRHPGRARGDRGRGTRRHRAPARGGLRIARRRAHGVGRDTARRRTRRCAPCCATSPRSGSTTSTACRPTSARGSAACRTTTSSSPRRANASTSWSSGSSARCSTSSSPACRRRSRASRPEDLAANREMVRDLNELLRERLGGRRARTRRDFLAKHGQFFPGARTLDDVIEQLAERMAAMQSLLRSMTPEQRAELQSMMDALLRDDRLRWDLAQLAANLDQLLPDGLGRAATASAATSRSGSKARSSSSAGSRRSTRWRTSWATSSARATWRRSTGTRSASCSATTRCATSTRSRTSPRRLEQAGYLTRDGDRLELTPAGHPADRPEGPRRAVRAAPHGRVRRPPPRPCAGGAGSATRRPSRTSSATRSTSTCRARCSTRSARAENAPAAEAGRGHAPRPDDFEVFRTEQMTRDGDRAARRHEPLDAAARLLPRGQEGRGRARHADPDAVPAGPPLGRSASPTTPARSGPRRSPS